MEQNEITTTNPAGGTQQTIIINQTEKKSNGVGTAGFVLAIIGLVFSWVPVLDWILWILGLVFSFVGVFKKPRGLAIAGLAVSLIGFIILIAVIGAVGAAVAAM